MEWVSSTLHNTSEHGVSIITTADAHTSAASSRLNWRPTADLNGIIRCARKTKFGFCACAVTFQLAPTSDSSYNTLYINPHRAVLWTHPLSGLPSCFATSMHMEVVTSFITAEGKQLLLILNLREHANSVYCRFCIISNSPLWPIHYNSAPWTRLC